MSSTFSTTITIFEVGRSNIDVHTHPYLNQSMANPKYGEGNKDIFGEVGRVLVNSYFLQLSLRSSIVLNFFLKLSFTVLYDSVLSSSVLYGLELHYIIF